MADEGNNIITDLNLGGPQPNGADTMPAAGIIQQSLKDHSAEHPNAPGSFPWQDTP